MSSRPRRSPPPRGNEDSYYYRGSAPPYNWQPPQDLPKQPEPTPSFTWGHIVNLIGVPGITGLLFLAVSWGSNSTQQAHLKETQQTEQRQRQAERQEEKAERLRERQEERTEREREKSERERMRESWAAGNNKLIEVLGRIDSRLSVTEKQQESMSKQFERLDAMISRSPGGRDSTWTPPR